MTSHIEETKKLFDEKFPDPIEKREGKGFALYCNNCFGEGRDSIKSFITSRELALIEKIEEWAKRHETDGSNQTFSDRNLSYTDGYNKALSDLLTFLQTLK